MTLKIKTAIIIFFASTGFFITSPAQDQLKGEPLIVIQGQVNCLKPERGPLSNVTIFNHDKNWGTLTDSTGHFSVKMGLYDTLFFSTTLHKDYLYYLKPDNKFEDHHIEITLEPDAIWLETVSVIGYQSLQDFEKEIIGLEGVETDQVDLTLPIVSKYAKQRATGDGSFELNGPLTYLADKFNRYKKIKRRIEKR